MRIKKILSLFFIVIFVFNSLDLAFTDTASNVITSKNDLIQLAKNCTNDKYSKGREFILLNDIDMQDTEFTPIALFCGTFNGNGHTVKNIVLKTEGEDTGFITRIDKDAIVKDLNIEGTFETKSVENKDVSVVDTVNTIISNAGFKNEFDGLNTDINGAIGGICATNYGKIINCKFNGKISGVTGVGGIVGTNKVEGIIDNCTNEAEIDGESMVGGIVGKNLGRIRNCKNSGVICKEISENGANVGGIAGYNDGVVEFCSNNGNVGYKGIGINVGGICGKQSGELKENINYAAVTGNKNVGGIVGMFIPYADSDTVVNQIKNDIKNEKEDIEDDIDEIEDKLIDKIDDLFDGNGTLSRLFDDEGVEGILSPDGPLVKNRTAIADSIVRALDSYTRRADKNTASVASSFDKIASAIDNFTNRTTNSIDKLADSVDKLNEKTGENMDKISDSVSDTAENAQKNADRITDNVDSAVEHRNDALDSISSDISSAVENANDVANSVAEDISSVADNSNSVANRVADSVESAVSNANNAVNKATDSAVSLTDSTKNDLSRLNDSLTDAVDSARDAIENVDETNDKVRDILDTLSRAAEQTGESRAKLLDEAKNKLSDIDISALDKLLESMTAANASVTQTINSLNKELANVSEEARRAVIEPLEKKLKAIEEAEKYIADAKRNLLEKIQKIRDMIDSLSIQEESELYTENDAEENSPEDSAESSESAFADLFIQNVYASENDDENKENEDSHLRTITDKVLDGESIEDAIRDVINIELDLDRTIGGEKADNAVIKHSINMGTVYADKYCGGVAGFMGAEALFKEGEELTFTDGTPVTDGMQIKAVINGCIDCGEETSKGDYVGGITGSFDMGTVKNCLALGKVVSKSGSYAGGITGSSIADIKNCISMAEISALNDIGGIAGKAENITLCYALPTISVNADRVGAIAGSLSGEAKYNYYIDEGLGGISGAGYDGAADPLKPSEMTGRGIIPQKMEGFTEDEWYMQEDNDYLPQISYIAKNNAETIGALLTKISSENALFHLKVEFVVDDSVVHTFNCEYGDTIPSSEVPVLEKKNGFTPHWDKDISKPILRNTVFTAVYDDATMTVSSQEDPPIMLVEGNFSQSSTLSYSIIDSAATIKGYKQLNAYTFDVSPFNSTVGSIKVHIRDEKKGDTIALLNGENAEIIPSHREGSYLVFEVEEPSRFAVFKKNMNITYIVLAVLLAIIGIIVIISVFLFLKKLRERLYEQKGLNDEEKSIEME